MTISAHKLRQQAQNIVESHLQEILGQQGTPLFAEYRVANTFDLQKLHSECLKFIADPLHGSGIQSSWWEFKRPLIISLKKQRLELKFLHCPPPEQSFSGEERFTRLICHRQRPYTQAIRPDTNSDLTLVFTPEIPEELRRQLAA